MEIDFEELDYRQTPLGELTLRRRANLQLGRTAFEVKLDEEFLMSSLFTEGETALARIALERCRNQAWVTQPLLHSRTSAWYRW